MKILALVFNTLQNDARVEKAVKAYAESGHEVRVIALAGPNAAGDISGGKVWRLDLDKVGWRIPWPEDRFWRLRRAILASGGLWFLIGWLIRRRQLPDAWGKPGSWNLKTLVRFAARVGQYRKFARGSLRLVETAGYMPDLVHANDFNTLPAAELLHDRLGVPFIYDSHELWSGRNRGDTAVHPFEAEWELEVEQRVARKSAVVVTVSGSIAKHLAQLLGIAEPKVIRNLPYAAKPISSPSLRESLRLAPDAKLMVYTGKATFNRGLEEAIDVMASLPQDIHLLVLGNFEPRFKTLIQARVAERRLQDRFHHHGPVPSEEVPMWASAGDLCLVPIKGVCLSYEYCLPNKLFEGIQAGLPVLATNLVEMKGTLEKFGCGVTYESGDIVDMRDKIQRILDSPTFAAELRRNARRAAEELNWETEKTQLVSLVNALEMGGRETG